MTHSIKSKAKQSKGEGCSVKGIRGLINFMCSIDHASAVQEVSNYFSQNSIDLDLQRSTRAPIWGVDLEHLLPPRVHINCNARAFEFSTAGPSCIIQHRSCSSVWMPAAADVCVHAFRLSQTHTYPIHLLTITSLLTSSSDTGASGRPLCA